MTELLTEQQNETLLTKTPSRVRQQITDDELLELVREAVAAAEDKKAIDLIVLNLTKLTEFTDYFIICSGNSSRQVQAIADEVTFRMRECGVRPMNTEGYNAGEWVLIDFGAFLMHVFSAKSRSFYDLERLWRDAEPVHLTSEPQEQANKQLIGTETLTN